MENKVLKFPSNNPGFTFAKQAGYNLVPVRVIAALFQSLRGIGPDCFVINHFSDDPIHPEVTRIMRGAVPGDLSQSTIARLSTQQDYLSKGLLNRLDDASRKIGDLDSQIVEEHSEVDGRSYIFVHSDTGFIGLGWYDSAKTTRKGAKMAAMMMYCLGIINIEHDKSLGIAAYNYLPFESKFLTQAEADIVVNSLVKEIYKSASKKTQPPG